MAVPRHRVLSVEDAAWFDKSAWLKVHTSIADVLRGLYNEEAVTVEAREAASRPTPHPARRPLWSRLLGAARPAVSNPYVRFRRKGTVIAGECVGGVHFGGGYRWTDSEEQVLFHIGWQPWRSHGLPFYRAQFPPMNSGEAPEEYALDSDPDEAAHLAVRTMRDVLKLVPSDLNADIQHRPAS